MPRVLVQVEDWKRQGGVRGGRRLRGSSLMSGSGAKGVYQYKVGRDMCM